VVATVSAFLAPNRDDEYRYCLCICTGHSWVNCRLECGRFRRGRTWPKACDCGIGSSHLVGRSATRGNLCIIGGTRIFDRPFWFLASDWSHSGSSDRVFTKGFKRLCYEFTLLSTVIGFHSDAIRWIDLEPTARLVFRILCRFHLSRIQRSRKTRFPAGEYPRDPIPAQSVAKLSSAVEARRIPLTNRSSCVCLSFGCIQ